MVAILGNLNIFGRDLWRKVQIRVQLPEGGTSNTASTAIEATVNMYRPSGYQSIIPLEGKYANDSSWDRFDEFIENYWQEIDERGGE